jgi:hypothetical protein
MRHLATTAILLLVSLAIGARAAVSPTQVIQTLSEQMILKSAVDPARSITPASHQPL